MRRALVRLTMAGAIFTALAYTLGGCVQMAGPREYVVEVCDDIANPNCAESTDIEVE